MIDQVLQFFKDPAKVTRLTIVGFFAAVLFSFYLLFTLPNDLIYHGGMIDSGRATGVYAKLFIVVGLAFVFCYGVIHYLQKTKKETIVYLDKKIDTSNQHGSGSSAEQKQNSFNINLLREKISKAKSQEEKWQQGLNQLCAQWNAGQGALYITKNKDDKKTLEFKSGFALILGENENPPSFEWGEGLIGQVAASGKSIYLDELPEGYAARIESGLGNAPPKFLLVLPIKNENEIKGVIEIATFVALSEMERKQAQEAGTILAEI